MTPDNHQPPAGAEARGEAMASITVNGKRIEISGDARGVSIVNGTITVGGVVVSDGLAGIVRVEWSGPLASLKCDAPVTVTGAVSGDVTADGPVTCGSVGGSVDANGPVTCGRVTGNLKANGPVVSR